MYRNETIANQKGMMKVASAYDTFATSNRQAIRQFADVDEQTEAWLNDYISKVATKIEPTSLEKEASFSNGLELFSNVRQMISNALGVSEGVAHDMTSSVITRSAKIESEYGGGQEEIIEGIINEMKGQTIQNPDLLSGAVDLHPMMHNSKVVQDKIKQRLISEMGMSGRDAELYKDVAYKKAQDLTTMLRPHKRDAIAEALIDVMIETQDPTSIYDVKDSPILLQSVEAQLEA